MCVYNLLEMRNKKHWYFLANWLKMKKTEVLMLYFKGKHKNEKTIVSWTYIFSATKPKAALKDKPMFLSNVIFFFIKKI